MKIHYLFTYACENLSSLSTAYAAIADYLLCTGLCINARHILHKKHQSFYAK